MSFKPNKTTRLVQAPATERQRLQRQWFQRRGTVSAAAVMLRQVEKGCGPHSFGYLLDNYLAKLISRLDLDYEDQCERIPLSPRTLKIYERQKKTP